MSNFSPTLKGNASRLYAGISFRPEVLEYLDMMAHQMGMNRSWVLNTIIMQYAKSNDAGVIQSPLSKETVIQI